MLTSSGSFTNVQSAIRPSLLGAFISFSPDSTFPAQFGPEIRYVPVPPVISFVFTAYVKKVI